MERERPRGENRAQQRCGESGRRDRAHAAALSPAGASVRTAAAPRRVPRLLPCRRGPRAAHQAPGRPGLSPLAHRGRSGRDGCRGERDIRERLGRARPRAGLGSQGCRNSDAPSPNCAPSTSIPTFPCASPASCVCSPAWTPSPKPPPTTAPPSSSPRTCTTTRRSASWSASWIRIASENLVEAMEELDRRLCALAPDAPEQSAPHSPPIPSGHSPRHRLLRCRQLAAATDRERFWTK